MALRKGVQRFLVPGASRPLIASHCFSTKAEESTPEQKSEPPKEKKVPPKDYPYYHTPPPCAAWDLSSPAWRGDDREEIVLRNELDPDNPDNLSRIVMDDYEPDYRAINLNRMHDKVKREMFAKWKADPERWSVAALATSYKVSQARVQAILLLKEWEVYDREAGLIDETDDELEELMHQEHYKTVRYLQEEMGMDIVLDDEYDSDSVPEHKTGPLLKFRTVTDVEAEHETPKPDPNFYIKRAETKHTQRQEEIKQQEAVHKRIPNKRWTFIVKDTTAPNVR